MNLDEIQDDIAAFADDDSEAIADRSGTLVFMREGVEHTAQLHSEGGDQLVVEYNGERLSYGRFLRNLAHLDVFAERLITRRPKVAAFVDGPARLESVSNESCTDTAITLLEQECENRPPFASRVVFVTADAGHGKTALLREYQHRAAEKFLHGKCDYLFWHVDLQGRQLLRLSEALMGDLGELRLSGLWMPTVVRLLRRHLLVLAIDGFDELAAEQGSSDALGALSLLVREMQDRGVIVAASRRTFFDNDDYVRRTHMIRERVSGHCEFDEIRLLDWRQKEAVAYLSRFRDDDGSRFEEPEKTYQDTLESLGNDRAHPMLSRPFLVTHVAKALLRYRLTPQEFVSGLQNPMEGVASVVKAFVAREVEQKWKSRETGEPYLTADQHMTLLTAIAEEMWTANRDRLPLDTVQTIASIWTENWSILPDLRRQILDMVKMHVLLTIPAGAPADIRAFDHPEFRDYFVASALTDQITNACVGDSAVSLGRFLASGQLPDAVARYAAGLLDPEGATVERVVEVLRKLVEKEWRPTFLQTNIGTLLPYLLNGRSGSAHLEVDARIVYSSLVFEGTQLRNLTIRNGTFLHANFLDVSWHNITFENCELNEVGFDLNATYENVVFEDCRFNGIRICQGEEEHQREYAPARIREVLDKELNIRVLEARQPALIGAERNEERRRLVHRLLKQFRRTTSLSEGQIVKKLHSDMDAIRREIIPLMERYDVLKEVKPHPGRGTPQRRWSLTHSLEEVLRADGKPGTGPLAKFWHAVDSK